MGKTIEVFTENEIQKVIEEIELASNTPELMKVKVGEDYILEDDGMFRDRDNEEAFFTAKSPLTDREALLKELALAFIDMYSNWYLYFIEVRQLVKLTLFKKLPLTLFEWVSGNFLNFSLN